jgi:PPOX class probable F420-dependent enzyme
VDRPLNRPHPGRGQLRQPLADKDGAMSTNQRAQIKMTDAECALFIEQQRTAKIATLGPTGFPHLVAMWYGIIDGQIWFETKLKSQKIQNLRRDDRITCLIEDGLSYDTLRGVSLEGRGVIVDDPGALWNVGVSVFERYMGPYTAEMRPLVEIMLHKRTAVRIDVERMRSWDHRKLGMEPQPIAGSTAKYLTVDTGSYGSPNPLFARKFCALRK